MSDHDWDDPFPLDRLKRERVRDLRERLRTLGYDAKTICARLGVTSLRGLSEFCFYYPIYRRRLRAGSELDHAILLLFLQSDLGAAEVRRVFPGSLLDWLLDAGVVIELPGDSASRIRSTIILHPYADYVFASDPFYFWEGLERRRAVGREVYIVGTDSLDLADATLRRPVRRVLDLCTGCGIHAILAAAHADSALGVDINPRAVSFARFNAALNGVPNVSFLQGDLYDPVAGQIFDLIIANPPFVAAPPEDGQHLYRDGGNRGDDVLKRIVVGLPDHVSPGGLFQSVGHIVVGSEAEREERLRGWLGNGGFGVFALDLALLDREQLAYLQNFGSLGLVMYHHYAREVTRWLEHLERVGIERVAHSLLAIRRRAAFHFQVTTLAGRTVTFNTRPPRDHIAAWVAADST